MTGAEYYGRQNQIWDDLFNRYGGQGGRLWTEPLSREIPPNKITADWAKILTTEAERHERLTEEHLKDRTSQALFAMNINRVSPASAVQYAIESLAGGGLLRYLDFLDGVRRHGVEFRQFLIETDLADTEIPHAFGVSIGTSQKPMNFEAIPKFEDEITFGGAFNIAMVDMLLLVLFLVALSAGAYLSFLRTEIG